MNFGLSQGLVFYLGMALACVCLALSIITLNVYVILLAVASAAAVFTLYRMWDIIEPMLLEKTGAVRSVGNYELMGSGRAAFKRADGGFYATVAAELEPAKAGIERERIEGIISRSNIPFRFVLQLEQLDQNKMCERLRTRRAMKEIALSRIGNDRTGRALQKASVLKREIEQLEHDIALITTGSRPVRLAQFIVCGSYAESRYLAEERARLQLQEISGQFGAVMGSQPSAVEGRKLLGLLEMGNVVG